MNRKLEAKAARYVLEGRVVVQAATFDDDGRVATADGTVTNDSGDVYRVRIDGDSTSCTCPYGTARVDAGGHAHDIALRVAAKQKGGRV